MKILFDNQICDSDNVQVNILSQGLQYGFGVFETMKLVNGEPECFREHMDRMKKSLDAFGLSIDYTSEQILKMIHDLSEVNGINATIIKTAVYKGDSNDHLILTMRENPYGNARYQKGFRLSLAESRRNPLSKIVYHKTSNYMENLLERQKALSEGFDEVIFLNINNHIAEGSVSNVFWVKDGELYTPSIQTGILNGIMRLTVINKANNHSIIVHECESGIDALKTADAVFLTNSIMGIMPVSDFENTCYSRDNTIMNFLRNG